MTWEADLLERDSWNLTANYVQREARFYADQRNMSKLRDAMDARSAFVPARCTQIVLSHGEVAQLEKSNLTGLSANSRRAVTASLMKPAATFQKHPEGAGEVIIHQLRAQLSAAICQRYVESQTWVYMCCC